MHFATFLYEKYHSVSVVTLCRRAYNIENMVDIKNLKKFHHAAVC
jgi:hypothetical protein